MLVNGRSRVDESSGVGSHRSLEDRAAGDEVALQAVGVHDFVCGKGVNLFLDWIKTAYRV